ncbi:type IV pilin [Haloplanus salilacus]|uniref:type IV pilin n=1 Tax=Haloplanus salilacus TaxID=2949994 RepID=UPI0030D48854
MVDRTVPVSLLIAVALGTAAVAVSVGTLPGGPPTVAASLSVDGERIALTNRAGRTVDVRRLDVVVHVDGTPLRHQPPVPFFSAPGFRPGPTGPFNAAADPSWDPGERASLRVASTNRPAIRVGDRVVVELRYDGSRLVRLSATA